MNLVSVLEEFTCEVRLQTQPFYFFTCNINIETLRHRLKYDSYHVVGLANEYLQGYSDVAR